MKKAREEEWIDRLSELPDSLVIHILSFMNVKKAAITSVLSKRWEFIWADLPILKFRADFSTLDTRGTGAIDKVRNFVNWVNRTLSIRTTNYLEKFQVRFLYHNVLSCHVDAWVDFAKRNNVKILNLRLYCFDDHYRPPEALYSCASMTNLHLIGCNMDSTQIRKKIEWNCLTKLVVQFSYVEQVLVDEILSSCPVLCTLFLKRCRGFDLMEVNSRSLRTLLIMECDYNVDAPTLKIIAPYIHRLCIWQPVRRRKLEVGNISSLVRAHIDCQEFSWDSISGEVMSGARQLLQTLQHANELYVGRHFMQLVLSMAVNGWQLPQSKRQLLIVDSGCEHKQIISGIISLLDSSPNLETLIIEGCDIEWKDAILEPVAEDDLAGDLLHLKTVEVINFEDFKGEPVLTLFRILLKRSPALEELRITSDVKDLSELTEMVQPILSYPRSSTKAVVHLEIA